MAIVADVSRRMADAGYLGHVKRNSSWGGVIANPAGGRATGVRTDEAASIWRKPWNPGSGGAKLREGKVAEPGDEPQGSSWSDGGMQAPGDGAA